MNKQQVEKLKIMMRDYRLMNSELRTQKYTQILAYLDGCLDGIEKEITFESLWKGVPISQLNPEQKREFINYFTTLHEQKI